MEKHLKVIIPIIIIVLISLGAYFIYPFLFMTNTTIFEFDDNNTSIKTTLIEASNITYHDHLTLQNEGVLFVTKKLKYNTESKQDLKYNYSFVDNTDCEEYIDINIDSMNKMVTLFILEDFDKQINVQIYNDDVYSKITIDYYKTLTRLRYHDGPELHVEEENFMLPSGKNSFMSLLERRYSKYTLDREDKIHFKGDISIINYEKLYSNEDVENIIQTDLKTYINSLINSDLYSTPKASEIWNLSSSLVWKEYLLKKKDHQEAFIEIHLNGIFYDNERIMLETSKEIHEFYYTG